MIYNDPSFSIKVTIDSSGFYLLSVTLSPSFIHKSQATIMSDDSFSHKTVLHFPSWAYYIHYTSVFLLNLLSELYPLQVVIQMLLSSWSVPWFFQQK